MTIMRCVTLGCVLALGAASAQAQSVVTHRVDNALVETTVTQTPSGTVITRRPLAAPGYGNVGLQPAYPTATTITTTDVDETVGVAPATRRSARTTRRVEHPARRATSDRTVRRTVRTTRRVAPPLVLAPPQRQVIYRTLVQQQVVPRVAVVPSVPGYPPFPPPATTGVAVAAPGEVVDDIDDDVYATRVAPAPGYPTVYRVGSVLPARVAVTPLPAAATVAVPAAQPYSYATVDGRVLLVDPVTNTVVADITP